MRQAVGIAMAALLLTGCSVRVNKDGNGEEKDVHLGVPFAHLDVHRNATVATSLGLPVYPGAVPDPDKDKKTVDVNLGFGAWKMQVQIAQYVSRDSSEKVSNFYRQKMAKYGVVLACHGDSPTAEPTRTADGLTCRDEGKAGPVQYQSADGGLELKAGSRTSQHIVAFKENEQPGTHFALVALELPRKDEGVKGED